MNPGELPATVAAAATTTIPTVPASAASTATSAAASATTASTAVAATTTTASTWTATSATGAATSAAFTRGASFVHHNIAAHEILTVQALNGAVCFFVVVDLDKAEPTRLPRKSVTHQSDVCGGDSGLSK
jgi:hypothetical protein